MKRSLEDPTGSAASRKRPRPCPVDRFSSLSDELILRIFSFLGVPDVCICQRLSHRLNHLADDSQIWRLLYYRSFVKPRSSRMLKLSRWLHEHQSLTGNRQINWRRRYRLSHNWSNGSCRVRKTKVPKTTPIQVQMRKDVLVTAEKSEGLKIWSTAAPQTLLSSIPLGEHDCKSTVGTTPKENLTSTPCSTPTALALDNVGGQTQLLHIAIGFLDSSFTIYEYNARSKGFKLVHRQLGSSDTMINKIAMAAPYIVISYTGGKLELYDIDSLFQAQRADLASSPTRALSSLKSYTAWHPMAMTVRSTKEGICVSVVFALTSCYFGWVVIIQETTWNKEGKLLHTRIGTSSQPEESPIQMAPVPRDCGPTSISYNHPYLLTAHADNTLTLFLVSSNESELRIGAGQRLWGHASSVAGAFINDRGKAISVTQKGGELRVWDLEGGGESIAMKRRLLAGDLSIRIAAEAVRGSGVGLLSRARESMNASPDPILNVDWVSFDEEKVVVLQEQVETSQDLVIYDFT